MSDRKPVLGDTKRPPVPDRMRQWLADADRIRRAREDGKNVDVLPGGGILVSDERGPVKP